MTDTNSWIDFTAESGAVWRYRPDVALGPPGGFGGVFAGEAADGTPVAVKVVAKDRPGNPLDARLLRREIEIGRRINEVHASMLLAVRDAAETDDALLLVLDRAERSLSHMSGLDEDSVIAVLIDVATGLQQLHGTGIIHRDLKPGNVLLHDGRWKLADFGIARDAEIGTRSVTFVGWGSGPYMAPELWEGRSPNVKTDLYAFGCLAYELLAGTTPFTGDQRSAHRTELAPMPPCENAMLRSLIGRLLAKDAGERPQDARAVLERLTRARLSRTPLQERIAELGDVHTEERARNAALMGGAATDAELAHQLVTQGIADLADLLRDALEAIQGGEPDAELWPAAGTGVGSFTLSTRDGSLVFDLWRNESTGPVVDGDDTMALGGGVTIVNRRLSKGMLVANVAYERVRDRFGWQLYQFTANWTSSYEYGPTDEPHGLVKRHFLDPQERHFMLHPAMHVWIRTTRPLDEDAVLGLFVKALDLQPPPSRN